MPAFERIGAWHPECNFALLVNAMSRRDALPQRSARRSYVDPNEVDEDQPTRTAARRSIVAPEDLAELAHLGGRDDVAPHAAHRDDVNDPTRSPRESSVALAELPQLASDDRSTRVGPEPAPRRSYVAAVECDEVVEDDVTSFLDRPSPPAEAEAHDDAPDSVTTYAARPSYVAREEQRDPVPSGELLATSELEAVASDERPSHAYASSELEEIAAAAPNEERDYEALSRYLFDDIAPANEAPPPVPDGALYADYDRPLLPPEEEVPTSYPRQPARCIRHELDAPVQASLPPLAPRGSRPSIHDGDAPRMHARRRSMPSHQPVEHVTPAFAPPQPMPAPRAMPSYHPVDAAAPGFAPPQPMPAHRTMPSHHPVEDVAPALAPPQPARRAMPSHHPVEDVAPALAPPRPMPARRTVPSHHPVGDVAPELAPPQPARRAMPSYHPADTFAAPASLQRPMPSHPSFYLPMSSRRSMPSMHPHDSSAESPWVLTAGPSTRRGAPITAATPFRVTPSMLAVVFVALLAATVTVAAVLFVRTDDRADAIAITPPPAALSEPVVQSAPAQMTTLATAPRAPAVAPPPMIVISSDDFAPIAADHPATAAPRTVAPAAAPATAAPGSTPATSPATPAAALAAKPAPAPVTAPAPRTNASPGTKKSGAKSVEDILDELGEEQLRR